MNYKDLKMKKAKLYLTPEEFFADACRYFQWCHDHPLLEEKVFQYKGTIVRDDEKKMRPFTKKGLASFLGIPLSRLEGYKQCDGFADAVEMIEDIIFTQKFEGAAAGLLNAGIITRDLGLADKQEIAGIADAPPVSFTIEPIASGTFLAPEEDGQPVG